MKMKKLISMVLAFCSLMTMAGCKLIGGTNTGVGGKQDENAVNPITTINMGYVEGTTHIYNATETSDYLIKNGQSNYKILVSDGYKESSYLENAVTDLQYYLEESTGVRLEIVEESNFVQGQKYISLGDTKLSEGKVSIDKSVLGSQGYTIKTIDKNIYISGFTDMAILWGVYGLLEYECGFDWFYGSVYALEEKESISLKVYDFVDVPDIEMRITNYGSSTYTGAFRKMRYTWESDVMLWGVHSALGILPYEQYGEEHPDWYADAHTQLCYNAKGNEAELELMLETIAQKAFDAMREKPGIELVCFSDADNFDFCSCTLCEDILERYGARSANPLLFSQKLAKVLKAKLEAVGDNRAETFSIAFLAYNRTDVAPVTTMIDPRTGEMTFDYAEELVSENVTAWYAPIGGCFTETILDDINAGMYKNMFGWAQLCRLAFYGYDMNMMDYLFPHDTTDALQDSYKALYKANANFVMMQGQTYAVANTGWSYLKNYLTSKFAWNVNADSQELIAKFFNGMYGSQGERMQKLYEDYHALAEIQANVWNCPKGLSASMLNAKYWPESLLLDWINEMYAAEKALLENGESIAYAQNVRAELLAYLYLYIELYEDNAQDTVVHEYAQKFVSIVGELGFVYKGEAVPINELVNEYAKK